MGNGQPANRQLVNRQPVQSLELDGSHFNDAINAFAFARLEGRERSSLVNASLAKISSGAITCVR